MGRVCPVFVGQVVGMGVAGLQGGLQKRAEVHRGERPVEAGQPEDLQGRARRVGLFVQVVRQGCQRLVGEGLQASDGAGPPRPPAQVEGGPERRVVVAPPGDGDAVEAQRVRGRLVGLALQEQREGVLLGQSEAV
jgi:hypothetical protein